MLLMFIGDMHYGEKGNSIKHNQQLIEFSEWAVQLAQEAQVDRIIQAGDYFHTRHELNTETLTMGLRGAEVLSSSEIPVDCLLGNHDLHYLTRLDISSVNALKKTLNVIDKITVIGGVVITPWIVDEEMWQQLIEYSSTHDYCVGHFEFNGFKVNDGYEMEHGLSHKALKMFVRVVSGHYHSQQTKDNVTYLGTPIPITMNEANEDHGVWLLDTETNEMEFIPYEKVKVLSIPFHRVDEYLYLDPKNTSIRIEFPSDLEDETVISETTKRFIERGFTEVKTKYETTRVKKILEEAEVKVEHVDNIDDVVVKHLKSAPKVAGVQNSLMEKLYRQAIEKGEE